MDDRVEEHSEHEPLLRDVGHPYGQAIEVLNGEDRFGYRSIGHRFEVGQMSGFRHPSAPSEVEFAGVPGGRLQNMCYRPARGSSAGVVRASPRYGSGNSL